MKNFFTILSKDEQTDLNFLKWTPSPEIKPRGVVQIIHGMAEYIERYDEFANFLTEKGLIVVGHDHLGHGDSVNKKNPRYGYFAKDEGPNILIEDSYQVTHFIQKEYPDLPYFVLGHSMGSFVLRNYLSRYSTKISGAIIMGTGASRPELKPALPVLAAFNRTRPEDVNEAIDGIAFGSFNQRFNDTTSKFDWISKNKKNVEEYLANPKTGFTFTNNGFYTLFYLMEKATDKKWFKEIRSDLPILITSGEQDPVGNFGKGPKQVALELSENNFSDITLHLYANMRHEILNEENNSIVQRDIFKWLEKNIKNHIK